MHTNTQIPAPAATDAQPWEDDEGRIYRIVTREQGIPSRPDVSLGLCANQLLDGSIEPDSVHLFVEARNELAPADARELAAAMLDAADELDAWRGVAVTQSARAHFSPADWLALAHRLTPGQKRHLQALERLAIENLKNGTVYAKADAQELLDGLHDEAVFYASRNPEPGVEPDELPTFRSLLRSVDPAKLTTEDTFALLSLVQRVMESRGGNGC